MTVFFPSANEKLSDDAKALFEAVCRIVAAAAPMAETKMGAGLPSFYQGERFIRVIPFRDHVNVEAAAILSNRHLLTEYKLTPKGMLQITQKQVLPEALLQKIVEETFRM